MRFETARKTIRDLERGCVLHKRGGGIERGIERMKVVITLWLMRCPKGLKV